jgi:tripartite-type tricarboxylate transporter receptor subunit TctC
VVPYPAGSTPDIIGRTLADRLQTQLGQPFVVDNRPGAAGSIGAEAVAKAPADGYTLLIGGNGSVAINKHLYKGLAYDPDRDLIPISLLARAAVTDMLGGNIDAMFAIAPAVLPHVKAGKLNALAITALARDPMSPDVTSVAELGIPVLELLAWNGLLAPAGTPADVVALLSEHTQRAMRDPQARETLRRAGFDVSSGSPPEFARWIRSESDKWARVIRASGATPDGALFDAPQRVDTVSPGPL